MQINELTASFGKLENEKLHFHDGLNVIYAPNESGKSTWCAFIRAMLYGIDSAERPRAGYLPDKLRYAPWSGAPMEGSMELTARGCDITLTRRTRAKNAPMREFTATYTDSNVPVEGMTGRNAGEQLTGVSRDVFCRSAFIEQGTVAVSGSPELEKRIMSIVSSGDEQTSYTEADEQLRAWQRKRRYNRRGSLPALESRIAESKLLLNEMNGSKGDMALLQERLESTRAECAALETAVTDSRKKQRKEALDRLNAGRAVLRSRSDEHDAALRQVSLCRDELRQSPFGGEPLAKVEGKVNADLRELTQLRTAAQQHFPVWPAILLLVLAMMTVALYNHLQVVYYIIGAAAFALAAIVLLLRYFTVRREAEAAQAARSELLKRYKAQKPSDISAMLEDYKALTVRLLDAEQTERASRADYEKARSRQSQLEETALSDLDFASGSTEAARLGRELAAARASAEKLSSQIASLNGRLSAMGEAMVLASDLSYMETEREALQQEYDAITLACETLKAADTELQSRFSPELGKLAGQYMSLVTGGRYSDVLINRDFSALAKAEGDTVAHESEYLSAGTLDLLYLAVRLAVCELALPDGEPCPLIIDDALVNLDDTRVAQAMQLLSQIAKERQVILFTCRPVS